MTSSLPAATHRMAELLRQQIMTTGLSATPLSNVQYMRTETYLPRAPVITAQAAAKVGYESASQFSREFKRFFGTTPAQAAASARAALVLAPT